MDQRIIEALSRTSFSEEKKQSIAKTLDGYSEEEQVIFFEKLNHIFMEAEDDLTKRISAQKDREAAFMSEVRILQRDLETFEEKNDHTLEAEKILNQFE